MPCATWVTSINEGISSEPILAQALETPVIDKKEQGTRGNRNSILETPHLTLSVLWPFSPIFTTFR